MDRHVKRTVALLAAAVLFLLPSLVLGLDSGRISDIRRADTSQKLEDLAEKYMREDATRKPKDFEEGTQIATEMATYLLYIQVRQNQMMIQRLNTILYQSLVLIKIYH